MNCEICLATNDDEAQFCNNCGRAVQRAKVETKTTTAPPKSKPRTSLIIIGGLVALAIITAVISIFPSSSSKPSESEANLKSISLLTMDELSYPFEPYEPASSLNFTDNLPYCSYGEEFDGLLNGGQILDESLLSHRGEVQIDAEIWQLAVKVDSPESAVRLAEILSLAASQCSAQAEYSAGAAQFKFLNARNLADKFGVYVSGTSVDLETTMCVETCEPSWNYQLYIAYHGSYVLFVKTGYSQNEPYEKPAFAATKMKVFQEMEGRLPALITRFYNSAKTRD